MHPARTSAQPSSKGGNRTPSRLRPDIVRNEAAPYWRAASFSSLRLPAAHAGYRASRSSTGRD